MTCGFFTAPSGVDSKHSHEYNSSGSLGNRDLGFLQRSIGVSVWDAISGIIGTDLCGSLSYRRRASAPRLSIGISDRGNGDFKRGKSRVKACGRLFDLTGTRLL